MNKKINPILKYTKESRKLPKYSQTVRFPGIVEDDADLEKNYQPKEASFRHSINSFRNGQIERSKNRNPELNIPNTIDHIVLRFHDYFDSGKFENNYRSQFGLSVIAYEEFHTVGIFAIVDLELFKNFKNSINAFISDSSNKQSYSSLIKYIVDFDFYGASHFKRYDAIKEQVVISLVDNIELYDTHIIPITSSLLKYCISRSLNYRFDEETLQLEILGANNSEITEIANNFDVIHTINSYSSAIVKPSEYNLKEIGYGFNITNSDDDLPVIGIIDTGIESATPLINLVLNSNDEYDLTDTGSLSDSTDHGTGVACFAALGRKLIPDHRVSIEADAKLVSVKILDSRNSNIFQADVIELIRQVHYEYDAKLFTLTVGYEEGLKYNSDISDYAYSLDLLAYELDILIFISIGNAKFYDLLNGHVEKFPEFHDNESTNLTSPGDSFNHITIGAAAGNFENNGSDCYSTDEIYPTIYTRTDNIDWSHPSLEKRNRKNKQLFKPDVVHFAGDIHNITLSPVKTGIKLLSSNQALGFNKDFGTSFSAPLVANIAAKLIRLYPTLVNNTQSIKALIINGCLSHKIDDDYKTLERINFKSIYGNGIPTEDNILSTNENECTFLIEDTIKADELKTFSLELPKYFLGLSKTTGIIKVSATLCFKFKPFSRSRLTYCPVHMGFGIFKDKDIAAMNKMAVQDYKFGPSWSQDYYYKPKMLSNVQSLNFNIPYSALVSGNCSFQIAVQCRLHKLLTEIQKQGYKDAHDFSLVITVRDLTSNLNHGNSLYQEMVNLNELEVLNNLDLEAEV
ncbi:MAG TPA: S8 family peptidase [Saprospiraceae bacterium]|jgi:hypothetical protein|nr:S8 family peptidase [Saprospiraceae bacterium]HMT71333.1 S8 family peptidase [Saprospiraceae bacterium]